MAIGKSISMLDAVARVRGRVAYASTLKLPGMLFAKVLRSPVPHGRLVKVGTEAAERVPGVVAIVTAADFEGAGAPALRYGSRVKDHPIVAHQRVRFVGEPIALIAAESLERAEAARDKIVVEYEELPTVYDALEALQAEAPTLHETCPDNCLTHLKLRHGDLAAGFAEADEIVEETFTSPLAQVAALEPHVTVAQWQGEQLTLWTTGQAPYSVQRTLAGIFNIPPENIRLIIPPLGGGYGGKGHVGIEPMVAALARKTGGRPVKLALTHAEEFVTVTRHAATIKIKTGVKRDGTLTARQVTLYWNAGAYADISPGLAGAGMLRGIGPYRLPAVHVDSYAIYTNLPSAGAYRGAMSTQGAWVYESHLDTIAQRLGIDPLTFRLKNLLHSGEEFATSEILHDVHFAECLEACAEALGWHEQRPETSKTKASPLKRGRGLAVMMKNSSNQSRSECRLGLDQQANLTLYTSTVEMGQGAHTALAQIAAQAVGVPLTQITVIGPDTAVSPFDAGTHGCRGTNKMGNAILNGAKALKEKLKEAAVTRLETPAAELSAGAGYVFVTAQPQERVSYSEILQRHQLDKLEALGEVLPSSRFDAETGRMASRQWYQGAGACEVEVDTETGQVNILRFHGASFAGRVINPQLAKLQNDGNVIFGLGTALLEEMIVEQGQIVNANLAAYKIPSFLDTPPELGSILLEAEGSDFHGIGEMTLPTVAPAIANAIADAVGVRIYDLPITAEKVLRALISKQ